MLKGPTPLHSLWTGCKILTVYAAWSMAIVFFASGLAFLQTVGVLFFPIGFFCWFMAGSIKKSLIEEEQKNKYYSDSDDDMDTPLAA